MADARRIALVDINGEIIKSMDVSGIDNANTMWPFSLVVETRCDQGHWHAGERHTLVPWGRRVRSPE